MKLSEVAKKIQKRKEFFSKIWSKREQYYCESCGEWLGKEMMTYHFDHLLEKNKYPEFEFDEDNIYLCCLDCHSKKTAGFPTEGHEKAISSFKINKGL